MTTLPSSRTFVVKIAADSEAGLETVSARVEHVPSGRRALVGSFEELRSFMAQVLEEEGGAGLP